MTAQVFDYPVVMPGGGNRIQRLVKELGSMNDSTRKHARQGLVALGKLSEPVLIQALHNGDHLTRWGAVKTLAEINDPSAGEVFVQALMDDAFDIRWIAAEGLISLGKSGLTPLLHSLIINPGNFVLRESSRHILHVLSQQGMRSLLKPLTDALDSVHPTTAVPGAARQILETIRQQEE